MPKKLINATHLGLINFVHPVTGASVGMWADVDCAPLSWREWLT